MGETLYRSALDSPIGRLELVSSKRGLVTIHLGKPSRRHREAWLLRRFPGAAVIDSEGKHRRISKQLDEYFDGRRRVFDLPLDLRGTEFQKAVWAEVTRIPFGCTATYGAIAHLTGRPQASRAVGAANGANPVPIIVPCHRVIGSNGSLTGYGGGVTKKRWLLAHEGALESQPVQMGLFRPLRAQSRATGS